MHRRQFIIGNEIIERWNFKNIKIENNLYLSYDKDLQIKVIENDCGKSYILGYAFQIDQNRGNPEDEIKDVENVFDCIRTWSGRYVLIHNGCLYMDACGMLGCFYYNEKGKILVSSSSAILNSLIKSDENEYIPIEHGYGMDWYPGPCTKFKGISRLLPNQIISFNKNKSNKIEIICKKHISFDYEKFSYSRKIEIFCEYIINLMKNIDLNYDGEITIPLTAGYDSRTLMAICLKSKIEFSTYTQQHSKITQADINIPRLISKDLNIKHEFIKRKNKLDLYMLKKFDEHTACNCVDADRLYYGYNQMPEVTKNKKMILMGGIWEVSRGFYHKGLIEEGNNSEKLESIQSLFSNVNKSYLHRESLKMWLDNRDIINNDMDWRDLFYLEQRVGCWLSSVEQAKDLIDADRIHPLNSSELISILMSIDKDRRINGEHQISIMEYCYPKLLKYPFNKETIRDKVKKKYMNTKNIYRNEGILGITKKIGNKIIKK